MLNQEQIEALAINYSLIEGNIAVARLADTATGRPVYTVRASGLQNFTGTRTSYSAKAAMIVNAVQPLKDKAISRAEQTARETAERVRKTLKEAGNDLHVCAPYPSGSSFEYMVKLSTYNLFTRLCKWRKGSISHNEPCLADVDSNYVAKFVKDAKQDATIQYEAYVAKLVAKIGPVTAATLSDTQAIWFWSFLTVTTAAGQQQIWKTQCITNVSKLGKVFNQFPTQQVKGYK